MIKDKVQQLDEHFLKDQSALIDNGSSTSIADTSLSEKGGGQEKKRVDQVTQVKCCAVFTFGASTLSLRCLIRVPQMFDADASDV